MNDFPTGNWNFHHFTISFLLQKPANIIENCVFDGCNSEGELRDEAVCNMIESYEVECLEAGKPVPEWRTKTFCRKLYNSP